MDSFDAIFIGSGHNALVAAAYLARNDRPGGLVRTEELTLPGFKHDVYSSAHPLFLTSQAYADLGPELIERGLEYVNTDLATGVSFPDGQTAIFSRDMAATIAEVERLAPGDGTAFGQMMQEFGAYAPQVFGLFGMDLASREATKIIHDLMDNPDGPGFSPFAAEFLLTARDVLESRFQSPVFRGMIAPWVMHLGRTPDSANSGVWVPLTLMALMAGGMATAVGGSEMLARALTRLIQDKGGVVKVNSPVERIITRNGKATGVFTQDGTQYQARSALPAPARRHRDQARAQETGAELSLRPWLCPDPCGAVRAAALARSALRSRGPAPPDQRPRRVFPGDQRGAARPAAVRADDLAGCADHA
jgi:phytoene dehydrogenase-like protein